MEVGVSDPSKDGSTAKAWSSVPNELAPEGEAQISHWGTTLRDFSALLLPYFLGLGIAIAHFLLFNHLDQKRIGIDTELPQSWVSTLSLVLVTAFRLCLCLALGSAFTQHLWRVVRLNPVKVEDLDRYYSMQNDPRALFHPRVLLKAPSLCAMAFLGFTIGLAVIFPPGALTVKGKVYESIQSQSVGVFNASFMGNGSVDDAIDRSLVKHGTVYIPPYFKAKPIVSSTAKMTLIEGTMPVLTSPCGPNCTYTISFDGPQVKCSSHMFNDTGIMPLTRPNRGYPYNLTAYAYALPDWRSNWTPTDPESSADVEVDCPPDEAGAWCKITSYYENIFFEWYSYTRASNITHNDTVATYPRTVRRLECIPGYGKYTANITFTDGNPSVEVSSTYIGSLVDMWKSSGRQILKFKEGAKEATFNRFFDPQGLIKAVNLFAVLTSFAEPLKGDVSGNWSVLDRGADGTFEIYEHADVESLSANGTIILDTAFNTRRFNLQYQTSMGIEVLDIAEHKINQALQNVTIALMKLNSPWNTTIDVTKSSYQNIFKFSPIPLIAPYACCLAAVIPFLLLGYRSLRLNGVPAMSGGFVQTLMTTTGSEALRDAAAAGCLGGGRNVPQQLKDMEIIYGELHDEGKQEGVIRRATFGLKEEIVELKKEAVYGR